jgi:anti-sigma factor RsiW
MRIDEGKLRAYLDQALPPEELEKVKQHLAHSPQAQAMLARLSEERTEFAPHLEALAPSPEDGSAAPQALRRLRANITGQANSTKTTAMEERIRTMFDRSFIKRYRPVIVTVAVLAVIGVAFSFAPVRALAGDLLKIFRVQNVEVVEVDTEHIRALENDPRFQGLIEQFEPQIEVIADSQPQAVDSLAEADELVSFSAVQITALPANRKEPNNVTVLKQKTVEVSLDKELLEAIFEAAEIEVSLPDSLGNTPIVVTQPDAIAQTWMIGEATLDFIQMTTPQIEYPDDVDLNELGVAGLQLLGMSQEEAVALAETIDWANTLILPIPKDAKMTVSEISVSGAKGFLFTSEYEEDAAAVMWQKDGMSYFINGDYPAEQIVEMAESVQ